MSYEEHRAYIFQQVTDFSGDGFEALALDVFRFQAAHNPLFARFLSLLGVQPQGVGSLVEIPFLPIQFFKNHEIKTGEWPEAAVFTSSGTTGDATSRHVVRDLGFYLENAVRGFLPFYPHPEQLTVLALLPAYLERTGSSLVAMADHFIRRSRSPLSGFFLHNTEELVAILQKKDHEYPVLLIGVSFALLDLAERYQLDLQDVIVMETGGMKGRRRELTRFELHGILQNAFHTRTIHSEYGMTELLSQAYSQGQGRFWPSATMRVLAREITDPLTPQQLGRTGLLNIVDLANLDTCSFIATDDLGRVWPDGSFEVLGRADNSDVRGCNLLVG